jgi:hypothetical protein
LRDGDPELKPWEERVQELAGEPSDIDEMLAEIEAHALEGEQETARGQLELFGVLLNSLATESQDGEPAQPENVLDEHRIVTGEGTYEGTWEDIVRQMRDHKGSDVPLEQYMASEARRGYGLTGVEISSRDAESFLRGSAHAGLLRIDR